MASAQNQNGNEYYNPISDEEEILPAVGLNTRISNAMVTSQPAASMTTAPDVHASSSLHHQQQHGTFSGVGIRRERYEDDDEDDNDNNYTTGITQRNNSQQHQEL